MADITPFEAQARALALVFGMQPDTPIRGDLLNKMQTSGVYDPSIFLGAESRPAWEVLAAEIALYPVNDDGDW